jgi:LPS sulfotransferase NodH
MSQSGFFIVGAPRSGTTLLQSILARHADLYSAPETSFFNRIIPHLGVEYRVPDAAVTLDHIAYIEEDFRYMTGIELRLRSAIGEGAGVRDVFEAIMGSFNREQKKYWVEKTTNHARAMMLINQFYPQAKFIHLIRDPVDSVGSMIRIRPTGVLDFRIRYVSPIIGFARVWYKCVSGALQYPHQGNVHHLFYEDLLAAPERVVSGVCEFLGVDYGKDLLTGFENEVRNLVSVERCPWQRENIQPGFRRHNVGKARRELSPGDVWLIQRAVKELASTCGYFVTSVSPSLTSRTRSVFLELLRFGVYVSGLELPLRRVLGALEK